MAETILIVDDEESIRRTFREWLTDSGCDLLTAGDAESALRLANDQPIDLAILDWNLGAGDDGLHLLQDLVVFRPDVVAILVTGYANQATPLDAMRMGVRDYLDKNHDLTRETFLRAVRRQLDQIRPAKRQRDLVRGLEEFRAAVEKTLPLVRAAGALTDPAPVPESAQRLLRFARELTGAADGALFVRHYDAARRTEWTKAYALDGSESDAGATPFSQSLAGAVASRESACVARFADAGVARMPFEVGRDTVLAAPLAIGSGTQAVLELFDKPGGFSSDDVRLARAAADLGAELFRQAQGIRDQGRLLADALEAAMGAGDRVARTLTAPSGPDEPAPAAALEQVRRGLANAGGDPALADANVELAEAIRALGAKHGPAALRQCARVVDEVRRLLDAVLDPGDLRS